MGKSVFVALQSKKTMTITSIWPIISVLCILQDIRFDLEKNQPRVLSLRDTADQLLLNADSPEMCQAKDKMHIIANRLKALLRLSSSYITSLESRLEPKSMVWGDVVKGLLLSFACSCVTLY